MADELPPPEPLPEGNISPEFLGQLEHKARWAGTFNEATTNLAQRQRYNQDITAYGEALAQQRAQHQYEALQKDKAAQNLYFKTQQMDLQKREAEARMQHANELFPLKKQAQESQVAADLAREKALVQAAALKSTAAQQEHVDTDAFHATINNGLAQGIKIGTPEYVDLVTRARLDAPAMKSEIFDDLWKATSRSPLTPEEAIDMAARKAKAVAEAKNEVVAATGFRGTPEEARARYGPSALLHETAKGVWDIKLPPESQDLAERAADKTRAVLDVKKDFAPKQQEVIDLLVAKRQALDALKPTDQQKIDFAVAKKQALKDMDPTDADKIEFAVARQVAMDSAKTKALTERVNAVAKAHGIPASVSSLYSEKLGEISGLEQQARDETDKAKSALIAAKKIKNEEVVRSLESIHPELRATRGLDEKGSASTPAPASHPMEGQIVRQKSTGLMGKIINGVFVPQ